MLQQLPAGIGASTSSYVPDPSSEASSAQSANLPVLSEILNPPAQAPITFESVVVTNVEGHTSPNELRKAAIDHLNMPGNNYIGIPHDASPVNEFKNPALFPMIYPTLYPYMASESAKTRGVKHRFPCVHMSNICSIFRHIILSVSQRLIFFREDRYFYAPVSRLNVPILILLQLSLLPSLLPLSTSSRKE
jgi:hypothetical protein